MNPVPVRKQIVVNCLPISYFSKERSGKYTPLFFLHGWRASSETWRPLFPYLYDLPNQLCFIDLPGFGRSASPPRNFTLDDYCDTVAEFMRKIGIKRAVLVGHSFGGRIALKLAATRPELAEKLVLADSSGVRRITAGLRAKRAIAKAVKPIFTLRRLQSTREKIYKLVGAEDYIATPHLQQTFVNVLEEDLRPLFPRVKVPTLIVWGEKDTETPLRDAEEIHRGITGSTLVVLKGAGHFSFLDEPEKFATNLAEFIRH